jgi:hypothetical protein
MPKTAPLRTTSISTRCVAWSKAATPWSASGWFTNASTAAGILLPLPPKKHL